MELRLPLIRQYFDMTKSLIKPEDYRDISDYWVKRIVKEFEWGTEDDYHFVTSNGLVKFKEFFSFEINVMTLGYPSRHEKHRILRLEHAGIEIRTGNPEWGAEPGKLYFVIKHGKIIE